VFIYFHGNAGDIGTFHRVDFYKRITSIPNCHVFSIDYRGFGLSQYVTPSEAGLQIDAISIFDYVNLNLSVPRSNIYLVGHSLGNFHLLIILGSGVAVFLSRNLTLQDRAPGGVILVSGYTSIPDAAMAYPIIPILYVSSFNPRYPFQSFDSARIVVRDISSEKWENDLVLERGIACPLLIVHGTEDFEIPVMHARKLFLQAIKGYSAIRNLSKPENLTLPLAWNMNETYSNEYFEIHPIKDEASVWISTALGDRVSLLEITLAGHNNIHGFEIFSHVLADFVNKRNRI
jgi:abhydrolase domain-containing protein 12